MNSLVYMRYKTLHKRPLIGTGFLAVCMACCYSIHVAADTSATPVTCDGLNVTLSDDKNFYIFTATAGGNVSSITGYSFNFGDRQSYRFNFTATPDQDRHAASVTHTYQNPGVYPATAQVHAKVNGKTVTTSLDACKASVTIGQPPATLPSVGSQGAAEVLASTFIVGTITHNLWLRHRRHSVV